MVPGSTPFYHLAFPLQRAQRGLECLSKKWSVSAELAIKRGNRLGLSYDSVRIVTARLDLPRDLFSGNGIRWVIWTKNKAFLMSLI